MSHTPITPDDPRLSAYVLGELDDADRAAVEASLAADPECRQIVEELQQTTAVLLQALHDEPVPALSEAQRASIRQAAAAPVRRAASLATPAAPGRRGIVPLLAATLACAALLIGLSVWDFDHPLAGTAAIFDDSRELLARHDGLALTDESAPEELRRLSRLESEMATREWGRGLDKNGADHTIHPQAADEFKELEGRDAELPSTRMSFEQRGRESLVQERAITLERESVGLATTIPQPAAPGNLGDVTDPSQDYLGRAFSAGGGAAAPGGGAAQRRAVGFTINSPTPASGQPAAPAPHAGAAQNGEAIGQTVVDYSQPAQPYSRSLQPQSSSPPDQSGAYGERRDRFHRSGVDTKPADPADIARNKTEAYFMFADEARRQAGQPAAAPADPAGSLGKQADSLSATIVPTQPAVAGRSVAPQAESAAVPEQRGVTSLESLRVIKLQAIQADAALLNLYFDTARQANGTQFVPSFALTDLPRLSENAPGRGGLAAGALAVPPVPSNAMTVDQDILSEARGLGEGESGGLATPGTETESKQALNRSLATLTWDEGRWFAVNESGQKIPVEVPGTEAYAAIEENAFVSPTEAPLSTFGLDVDTASYANVRRFLMEQHRFPPPDAVRIEELVNYFSYTDPAPSDDEPLAVRLESDACPWNTDHRLVRIGLKAREIDLAERPATTLVFLIDTSGSMRDDNKLPLVKQSLRLLVDEMTENDRIAIVTYSSDAGLLLNSTSGEQRDEIIAAIDGLQANGSTNGEKGLQVAYDVATQHFIDQGQNRVILCTDGDFNVGTSATDPLVKMISDKRQSGVFLSICGYGSGNIKDEKLERIADTGNGQYHYIDNLKEARKVFLDELSGMLYTVAKDVKLQVEFNPARVASYRLLGYENRALAAEDFNNDRVDSGDMGAGHSVTALYEIVPVGVVVEQPEDKESELERPKVDPLKYQGAAVRGQRSEAPLTLTRPEAPADATDDLKSQISDSAEWLTVKLRYKQPDGQTSVKREFPLVVDEAKTSPSADLEWSAAVASFGMLLRSSSHAGQSSLEGVLELVQGAKGTDESGRRREFIDMVLQTRSLVRGLRGTPSAQPRELSSTEARQKATVGGKYEDLLDKLEARTDAQRYGAFHDYGWSADPTYAGRDGLPAGYWVYVYPDWYIWGETVSARE